MKLKKPTYKRSYDSSDRHIDTSDAALQKVRVQLLLLPQTEAARRQRCRLLTDLASIYWRRGNYPAAIQTWQQLIALAQQDNDNAALGLLYAALATTYAHSGDYTAAIKHAKHALVYDPHNITMMHTLANAFDFAGEDEQAFFWWRRAVKQDPSFAPAYEHLGGLHYRRGEFAEAEKWLRKALELDPTSETGLNELGNMYITLERYDEALAQFKEAMRLHPKNPHTWNNTGNCYLRMGSPEEARRYYERRIEMQPEDALSANIGLGLIYRCWPEEKARAKGDGHFRRALEIYQTGQARLLARLLEHDARRAVALTGLGDEDALPAWRAVLAHPEIQHVGKGPWLDWIFSVRLLARCPHPPSHIAEIVELLLQHHAQQYPHLRTV